MANKRNRARYNEGKIKKRVVTKFTTQMIKNEKCNGATLPLN